VPPDYKGELPESCYFVQKMRTTRATMPDELNVRAGHRVAGNGNVRRGLRYRHLQSSRPKADHPGASMVRFRSRDKLSRSGMRRFTLLELSSMELHEVAHVRRCFAG
jgi:hypothetical protein